MTSHELPLALTMGEPSGIASEVTLKAWLRLRSRGPAFFYVGSFDLLFATSRRLGLDVPIRRIGAPDQTASVFADALPVLDLEITGEVVDGVPSIGTASTVVASIEKCVSLATDRMAGGVVTNPIQKSILKRAGFRHPGHTEFLQELAGPGFQSIMMLVGAGLRVVPVTVHQSLKSAVTSLTTDSIIATGLATNRGLVEDFCIVRPRLAVAGLNPHAGEAGDMGDEEIRIVRPAIEELRQHGLDVVGPMSPDTMFTHRARLTYDVAICLYHDQALIPLKTLDVDGGVNVTLGLPFVRTSPDHGTALDIAGKGMADPGSLVAALDLAHRLVTHRHGGKQK